MTNNKQIKKDASELLEKVIEFKRNYKELTTSNGSPADDFERELRLILMVARTDEVNEEQLIKDKYF